MTVPLAEIPFPLGQGFKTEIPIAAPPPINFMGGGALLGLGTDTSPYFLEEGADGKNREATLF